MTKKTLLKIVLFIGVPVLVYFLWPTDESRIKKLFREGAKAVEEQKTEEVMSKISFNYTDDHGLSYLIIKRYVEQTLREMSDFSIEYEITRIDISGDRAAVELDIRVIATRGKDTGYWIGDAAKPAQMKFSLEKERARWLIVKAAGLPTY